ncbi:conjugal transfer protein TraG N-terminal domain-containing protein [Yoonia sp. SS1-5]|uniref:Conjugal transfer protein TraG N-terminal domain-containing protein n=1 Tax=Yoonia rhodophyticola TaxID=3137370 RepID=A0AAN0MA00_9RHOB
MLEIYTTGGGDYLVTTLNAVAAFFNTNNARALVAIGLMVGMVILVFQVMFNGDLRMAIKTYVMIALVGALSVVDRSDVIIFDSTKGPLWSQTVSNVPTSVAYIGSATSSVSNALTRQIETLFSPPTNMAYQRHGMLFGATLMTKSARWRSVTSTIHENLTNFMDQCVIDAVDLRYIAPDVVTRSGNLETTIGANLPASLAYYDTITRTTRNCADGWADIVSSINTEVDTVIAAQAASAFQGPNAPAAIADIRNTISDFAPFAGYASTSAEQHIKQAMLIAAFDDAANRGISATGNAAALQHLQSARAEVQTRSSYQAVGANALSWVPYLKIVFENLYYGAFPIALALMMTPLCLSVIRGYFGGFVWLASWEPLSAILHSLMMNATAERFQTITSASTSGAYTDSIMNWANHFGVYSVGQDVAVMAGYLMMSIPFVAAAIFWGTQRMVGLATSMLAVSQSAAAETGREMATGNLAYANASVGNRTFRNLSMDNYARNNASYDNVSANRTVTSPFTDTGRSSSYASDGSLITYNPNGTVGIDGGSSRVNTATNIALGNSVVGSLRSQASEAMERGEAFRNSFEQTHNRLSSRTSSFMQSLQQGESFSNGRGLSISAEERETLSNSISVIDQFAEQHSVSRQTAFDVGLYAQAGVSGRALWANFSAGVKSNLQRRGVTQENFEAMITSAQSQNMDTAVSDLSRASREYSSSETGSLNTVGDKGFRDTIDDLSREARSAEVYRRASSSYSEAADRAQTQFVDNRVDLSAPFVDWMIDHKGMSPTQAAGVLNGRSSPEAAAALRSEFSDQYARAVTGPSIAPVFGTDIPAPNNPGAPRTDPGDVHDARTSMWEGFADQSLQNQMTILRGSNNLPSTVEGSASIQERAAEQALRNSRAQDQSIFNLTPLADEPSSGAPTPSGMQGTVDAAGFYRAPNISYDLGGKVRVQAPRTELVQNISQNAHILGNDIGVVITSAGQPSFGSNRTGSHRHDHGNAVDFTLTRNGERVAPSEDPALYAAMIQLSARQNPGIGHYEWGLHVGGGTEAFWGPDRTSASADSGFAAAYQRGRANQ